MKFLKSFFLIFFPLLVFAIERKVCTTPLKVSVIIPCHHTHFPFLEPLLICYEKQSSLPDEIVISLSNSEKIPPLSLQEFERKNWPFSVRLLKNKGVQLPGKNRNCACTAATGDVMVCQDADDLPHPQRIEIIRYLFENFKIDHLLHEWIGSGESFELIDIKTVENQCLKYRIYEQIPPCRLHNGSAAFLQDVFEKVHWRTHLTIDEDTIFNRHSYIYFPNHYVLSQPLIQYRNELSTFNLDGNKKTE